MNRSTGSKRVSLTVLGCGAVLGLGATLLASAADTDPAPTAHSDSVGAAITDTGITAKVKSAFAGDDRLKGSHIRVKTTNGVVTLSGSAPSSDSRSAADDIAKNVDGVRSVDDQVTTPSSSGDAHRAVASTERVGSDSWITTKVKSEILADSLSKGFKVSVKTTDGVVRLRGVLPNDDAVAHVKDLAEKVKGVKSVNTSQLKASSG
jgi:hyperosmotically inducible protein